MITKLKWALVGAVAVVGLLGGVGMAQTGELKANDKGEIRVKDDKKLPIEVSIPEARVDKTKILTLELRVLNSDMQALETKYKELKGQIEEKQSKLFAEFTSALKTAGVPEDAINKYQVNLETLKMTLRPETPAADPKKP